MPLLALPLQRRIVSVVVVLVLLGQIMLFSATGVSSLQKYGSEFYYVFRQGLCAIAGLLFMLLLSKIRFQLWYKAAYLIIAAEIALVGATFIPGVGHHAGGATRWLLIHGFLLQPSELGKLAIPIYAARMLADYRTAPFTNQKIFWVSLPPLLLLGLIFKQLDLGTTTLLVLCLIALFFVAGMRLTYLLGTLSVGAAGFIFAMLHYEFRRKRLFAFLNPWEDPQGSGFQTIQSFLSFHSGGLFGAGIGNGNSKLFFLPEVHTDFIYALVGEELGFVGTALVLVLFVYLSYLLFRSAFKASEPFACFLAFGISFLLVSQVAVNIGGVTGILPVKGLPLPFISWGRSALLVNLSMVGILLNIIQQSGNIKQCETKK